LFFLVYVLFVLEEDLSSKVDISVYKPHVHVAKSNMLDKKSFLSSKLNIAQKASF